MSSRLRGFLWAVFILAAALIAYYPALHGELIWDDNNWTKQIAPLLKDSAGLWHMWSSATALQQYFPLAGTSFWLDYHLWGYETFPYHVENVVLHVLGAMLFWRLLTRLEVRGAGLAAAIFALHPVMVESAGWITERKNVLSLPLFLGAVLAYGRFAGFWKEDQREKPRHWGWYVLAAALFLAAMLAKITALCFPAVVLVLAWWKQGRIRWKQDMMPVVPLLIPASALGLVVSWVEKYHLGAFGPEFEIPFVNRLLVAGRVPWFYAGKLLWPVNLCFHYPGWKPDMHSAWSWLLLAATAAVPVGAWLMRKHIGRGLAAALFLYLGILFPVLGFSKLTGMRFTFVADRWTYVPSLALIALVASALAKLAGGFRPAPVFPVVGALILSVLGFQTWKHAGDLKTPDTFFGSILKQNPECPIAWCDLGEVRLFERKLDEAVADFKKALSLSPEYPNARIGLGSTYLKMNQPDEAISEFQHVLDVGPSAGGDRTIAVLHADIAAAMLYKHNADEAIRHYEQAVKYDPDDELVRTAVCRLLLQLGRLDEAYPHYCKAMELSSGQVGLHLEMEFLKHRLYLPALFSCKLAVRMKPDDWGPLADLAWMMATGDSSVRDGPKALELASKANRLSGGTNSMVLHALAAAQAESGRFSEAVATAEQAIHFAELQTNPEMAGSIRQAMDGYSRRIAYHDSTLGPGSKTVSNK